MYAHAAGPDAARARIRARDVSLPRRDALIPSPIQEYTVPLSTNHKIASRVHDTQFFPDLREHS